MASAVVVEGEMRVRRLHPAVMSARRVSVAVLRGTPGHSTGAFDWDDGDCSAAAMRAVSEAAAAAAMMVEEVCLCRCCQSAGAVSGHACAADRTVLECVRGMGACQEGAAARDRGRR